MELEIYGYLTTENSADSATPIPTQKRGVPLKNKRE